MRLGWPKQRRVVRERDFKTVLSRKCFVCNGMMRLYAAANGLERVRFGVSVGRKCGTAVLRNRLKRLAREAFRLNQHQLPAGRDYILILSAGKGIVEDSRKLDFKTFECRFLQMMERLNQKPCFRTDDDAEKEKQQ